jgi:hypothetical protein
MKLFPGKVNIISIELAKKLVDERAIETEAPSEVELDIQSVLKEYIRTDRELTEKAKDFCEEKGLPFSSYLKVKRKLADQLKFITGDEALDYIMEQLILMFMNSRFVDEVFLEDHEMKRAMRTILKHHMEIEDEIDQEARAKIKNLQEGTRDWEIEYAKAMSQVKKRRGLQ